MEKNNSALFFTCSLVEFIGRETKNKRQDILNYLGKEEVSRIFKYADVFHCEPIEKVAEDFIERNSIVQGEFDNVAACKYTVPDYWDIGEVFERLIEDIYKEAEVIKGIFEIYQSWIADKILNFNSDLYYQSREYIAICYREGKII
ncbi:MAG: hypothetical protein HFI01_15975 [Lachnospiraceae bacterium]|jgi:hypothetical protein|nr:hypothetical protein [Lachnospiraceae bacterium]